MKKATAKKARNLIAELIFDVRRLSESGCGCGEPDYKTFGLCLGTIEALSKQIDAFENERQSLREEIANKNQHQKDEFLKQCLEESRKAHEAKLTPSQTLKLGRGEIPYPCTIVNDRYGGAYSGTQWIAWNLDPDEVSPDSWGSDVECSTFFEDNLEYGRGDTPDAAALDLHYKLKVKIVE